MRLLYRLFVFLICSLLLVSVLASDEHESEGHDSHSEEPASHSAEHEAESGEAHARHSEETVPASASHEPEGREPRARRTEETVLDSAAHEAESGEGHDSLSEENVSVLAPDEHESDEGHARQTAAGSSEHEAAEGHGTHGEANVSGLSEGEHGSSEGHGGHDEETCEEHHGGADVVLVLFFMLLLGLAARYCLQSVPVPYTALLLVVGLVLGAMQIHLTKRPQGGDAHHNTVSVPSNEHWEKFAVGIDAWQSLQPELLLLVFLPALIFSSAFSLDFHITKRSFGQVLTLAGPGVIIGTCITAVFVKYVFPYEWCWPKAFMFGAMISATDPVAVVALLKEVGASKRLGTVIEGESLFNDGTAFVFFLLFRDMIPTSTDCLNDPKNCLGDTSEVCETGSFVPTGCLKDRGLTESIGFFLQLALGGPAIGILFGFAATFWIQYIYNDLLTEISITLATAYLTFYVAEDVAEVSGVLAVVALGLFMGSFAKDRISSAVHEPMHVFWEMMEYVANTLIFVYTGLKLSVEIFDSTNPSSDFINRDEWGYAILLYGVLQVIRFITIFSLLPVLRTMGYGMTWKDALVAVWGGLRGAVGLALALIVELDTDHIPPSFRSYTIFYLGFVVIATLLINGTTMPYLLKVLGVTKASPEKLEVLFHLLNEMEECGEKLAMHGEDELLGIPDHAEIQRLTALNIAKIVPNHREIYCVMESASEANRPSALGMQHNLHQRSMSRVPSLARPSLLGIMEDVEQEAGEQILDMDKTQKKTFFQLFRERFRTVHRKDIEMTSPIKGKENYTPDMLVQDLRSRLLQGVKTAYAEWLEKGYINAKSMFDLIASADHAIDKLEEPICDWKYIEKFAKPAKWRVEVQKLKRCGCKGPVGEVFAKSVSKLLFDSMLYAVLLARTFIMAHAEAEHTLHEHIQREMSEEERNADPRKIHMLEKAAETVLKESRQATKTAYELMRDFKMVYPEILRAIKTRLSAQQVLLEKQSYVQQIECAGLIENREATLIREMIDAKIKYLTYNALMLDLPNSHDLLHSHALFVSLPANLFDSQVWPHAKPKIFTKGDQIFSLGMEPRHVTIVVRGLVKMIDPYGNESPIGDGFGSVLGVSEIMLNRPRSMTMHCETTVEVIQIDRNIYQSLVERFLSVKTRSWQLTGMMLTYLHPWGDLVNCSILDLGQLFRNAQVLEFEPEAELRVRTRSYLVAGTVKEAGFVQGAPKTIVAPSPLGPGLGIYNCITAVKVLRIPAPEGSHTVSATFGNTKRMLARSSSAIQKISMPLAQSKSLQPRSAASRHLLEIPEGGATEEGTGSGTEGPARPATARRSSFENAFSADLETRAILTRRLHRNSIEF